MTITIRSINEYNGFFLKEDVNFDGNLCIFIGKNGTGKTRLLQAIQCSKIELLVDGVNINKSEISLVSISQLGGNNFSAEGSPIINEHLAIEFLKIASGFENIDDMPHSNETHIIEAGGSIHGPVSFNVREALKRASSLFEKSFKDISKDELKLSIILNKEYSTGIHDGHKITKSDNLSQLTMDFYQAKELIEFMQKTNKHEGKNKEVIGKIAAKFINNRSPLDIISDVIEKLFRGKFMINSPSNRDLAFNFKPELKSKKSNKVISTADLSSGEKTIFGLALSTFEIVYSIQQPAFNKKKVVMFDEPDAHLHPQMILDFYECLNSFYDKLGTTFMFTTHSPTTVALAPTTNIFSLETNEVDENVVACILSKDRAIAELLDGVSQIAIDPENSRQVYVENENDGATYELIYNNIKNRSSLIDKGITLSFISAGQKIAKSELEKNIKAVYGEDTEKMNNLINRINGSGNCNQVIGVVEYLQKGGSRTVRGLIDWDNTQRNHDELVKVSAKGYAYSIENLVYDPLSLYAFLTSNSYYSCDHFFSCDDDFAWRKAIDDQDLMQEIIDVITYDLFGRKNLRDHTIKYMNGMVLLGDKEYFIPREGSNGHSFERVILDKYPKLNEIFKRTSGLPFVYYFISKVTLGLLSWEYLNQQFELTFSELQK